MCRYKNGRRQPISRSLSLLVGSFKRGGEESVVCLLRSNGHFLKAQQVNPRVQARIANGLQLFPWLNSETCTPGEALAQ